MKVTIDKELLDKLLASIDPVESNWLDKVPEKHRKFAAYWDELGRPSVEYFCNLKHKWLDCYAGFPSWMISTDYRIKNDPHWQLRLKWVNSGKTLPIEYFDFDDKWRQINYPVWDKGANYREAKPWYEQEISNHKPILLKGIKSGNIEVFRTYDVRDKHLFTPLTDQEIDALKRGF